MHPELTPAQRRNVRQQYTEVQNWTRHYEQLIVNANVLIVTAGLVLFGLAYGEGVNRLERAALMVVPIVMSMVGLTMTQTLFRLYRMCIERLIRLERLMGCHDSESLNRIDGQGALVPEALHSLPIKRPTSVNFFLGLHAVLLLAFVILTGVRSVS